MKSLTKRRRGEVRAANGAWEDATSRGSGDVGQDENQRTHHSSSISSQKEARAFSIVVSYTFASTPRVGAPGWLSVRTEEIPRSPMLHGRSFVISIRAIAFNSATPYVTALSITSRRVRFCARYTRHLPRTGSRRACGEAGSMNVIFDRTIPLHHDPNSSSAERGI